MQECVKEGGVGVLHDKVIILFYYAIIEVQGFKSTSKYWPSKELQDQRNIEPIRDLCIPY